MRGDGRIGCWARRAALVLAAATGALWPPAAARAQMGATVWLSTSTAAHDALANCLAKAMWNEFVTAPVVFAPPRRAAYVNLWPRASQPVDPVATFHIEPQQDGMMRIGWQRLANAPAGARWDASAKAAASRCAAGP